MDEFFDFDNEFPGENSGGSNEVERFESMLQHQKPEFFDLSTIREIYDFYLMTADFEKALKLLDFGLTQYPGEKELYTRKAELLLEMGKPAEAMQALEKVMREEQDHELILLKAQILSAQGLNGKAIAELRELLTWTDNQAEAWFQMGTIYSSVHSFMEAANAYHQALRFNPGLDDALFEQVFCLEMAGEIEKGIETYEAYLDDNPYNHGVWYNLGILYSRMGLHEKAIDAYDYSLAIVDPFPSAWYNKGCSLMELGKFEEAIRIFLEALRLDNRDVAVLFSIAECYENLGDTANARYYYRKVTTLSPDMADAWYGIGYSLEQDEKYFEAIHYYRKTIGVDADHYEAWQSLAFCEFHAGNEASALEALEEAIRLNSGDASLWIDWSMLMKEEGKLTEALDILQEGITLNPELSELYYLFAGLCFQMGKHREGMVYMENALIMDFKRHPLIFEYFKELKQFQPVVDLIRQYKRK